MMENKETNLLFQFSSMRRLRRQELCSWNLSEFPNTIVLNHAKGIKSKHITSLFTSKVNLRPPNAHPFDLFGALFSDRIRKKNNWHSQGIPETATIPTHRRLFTHLRKSTQSDALLRFDQWERFFVISVGSWHPLWAIINFVCTTLLFI